jgi:hypothetical protein
MATAYSSNLALALPATGELSGTWGTTVNTQITNMLDEALGYQAFSATGGADTLTIPDGTTGVARSIYIQLNGTGGGSVAVPATKTKMYFVFNNTASAITFKVTGQTGVSIPAAAKMALVSNGTDIIIAQNYFTSLTLGSALPVLSGGTGITSFGTGVATALGVNTNAAGGFTTIDGTATLTNKRINPRTLSTASTATLTPDISLYDQYNLTAQASILTVAAPIGTPVDGNKLIIRILNPGTGYSITWNATYTVIGTTLPASMPPAKMIYVGCIYNSTNTRWDVVAVTTQV